MVGSIYNELRVIARLAQDWRLMVGVNAGYKKDANLALNAKNGGAYHSLQILKNLLRAPKWEGSRETWIKSAREIDMDRYLAVYLARNLFFRGDDNKYHRLPLRDYLVSMVPSYNLINRSFTRELSVLTHDDILTQILKRIIREGPNDYKSTKK